MFPVHFSSLLTISGIAVLTPVGSDRLASFYCMLFWPLPLDASLPYCSILDPDYVLESYAVQISQYPKKLCPWTYSIYLLRSYRYSAMLVVYPRENFVALKHQFCGTRVLTVSAVLGIPSIVLVKGLPWSWCIGYPFNCTGKGAAMKLVYCIFLQLYR